MTSFLLNKVELILSGFTSLQTILSLIQHSVDIGSSIISAIGFVDDTSLVCDSLSKLAGLLHLTKEYCRQYHVELVPDKMKLLVFVTYRCFVITFRLMIMILNWYSLLTM